MCLMVRETSRNGDTVRRTGTREGHAYPNVICFTISENGCTLPFQWNLYMGGLGAAAPSQPACLPAWLPGSSASSDGIPVTLFCPESDKVGSLVLVLKDDTRAPPACLSHHSLLATRGRGRIRRAARFRTDTVKRKDGGDIAPALDWTYIACRDDTSSFCYWSMQVADQAAREKAPRVYAIIASVYVGFYVFMTTFMRMPGRIWKPYPEKEISL